MIEEIIQREWDFFQKVQHIDGRASCQDDFETFYKQRKAQYLVYPEELLLSYLEDLKLYKASQRNPIMEKYAYMMETTDKDFFQSIQSQLPVIDNEKKQIIQVICQIETTMREEFQQHYPTLSSLSRSIYTNDDEKEKTSFETYLRGELMTYSSHSLYLYGQMIIHMWNQHQNIVELINQNTVKEYGYQNLEEAENALRMK
jgi:hypothetical protein